MLRLQKLILLIGVIWTVLDMNKVPNEEKSKFSETAEFGKTLPELNAGLVPIIEKIWTEEVLQNGK